MNFEIQGSFNPIKDYNQIFNDSLKKIDNQMESASNFNEVFENIGKTPQKNSKEVSTIKGGVEFVLGADAINAQKVENISDSARFARDLGEGFSNGLNSLNEVQREANKAQETFAAGGDISVHELMIATEKSSLAMQMAIQLRNQMINAYTEFKNLNV